MERMRKLRIKTADEVFQKVKPNILDVRIDWNGPLILISLGVSDKTGIGNGLQLDLGRIRVRTLEDGSEMEAEMRGIKVLHVNLEKNKSNPGNWKPVVVVNHHSTNPNNSNFREQTLNHSQEDENERNNVNLIFNPENMSNEVVSKFNIDCRVTDIGLPLPKISIEITPMQIYLTQKVLEGVLCNLSDAFDILNKTSESFVKQMNHQQSSPLNSINNISVLNKNANATSLTSSSSTVKTHKTNKPQPFDVLISLFHKFKFVCEINLSKIEAVLVVPIARRELRNKRRCWGEAVDMDTLLPEFGSISLILQGITSHANSQEYQINFEIASLLIKDEIQKAGSSFKDLLKITSSTRIKLDLNHRLVDAGLTGGSVVLSWNPSTVDNLLHYGFELIKKVPVITEKILLTARNGNNSFSNYNKRNQEDEVNYNKEKQVKSSSISSILPINFKVYISDVLINLNQEVIGTRLAIIRILGISLESFVVDERNVLHPSKEKKLLGIKLKINDFNIQGVQWEPLTNTTNGVPLLSKGLIGDDDDGLDLKKDFLFLEFIPLVSQHETDDNDDADEAIEKTISSFNEFLKEEEYDDDMSKTFAMQDEIVNDVATRVKTVANLKARINLNLCNVRFVWIHTLTKQIADYLTDGIAGVIKTHVEKYKELNELVFV